MLGMPNIRKPQHLKRVRINTRQPKFKMDALIELTGKNKTESIETAIDYYIKQKRKSNET